MNADRTFSSKIAGELAGEVVRTFGSVRLRAFGTSMVPAILPGDLISIERAGLDEIVPGEVVLFTRNDRLFIHRVIDRSVSSNPELSGEPCVITRGDRLPHTDPPVRPDELLGRVVSIQRGGRPVSLSLRLTRSERWTARLLQTSDLATSFYLRLSAFSRLVFHGRSSCRV
jgi:signal peptidase I